MTTTNDALVTISSGDELDVRSFSVQERMSTLFRIELLVRSKNQDIDLDEVIGHAASFALRSSASSPKWHGVVVEMELLRVESAGLATYRLLIQPRAWLLTQRKNYRIFQFKSELEIVQQLLDEWGVVHEARVDAGQHLGRKFRVQYGESDFSFLSRMLEDAGISFYFEQQGSASKLVLDDAPETRPLGFPLLRFHDEPRVTEGRFVTKVAVRSRVRPGAMRMSDVDYRRQSERQPYAFSERGLPQEGRLEQYQHEPGAFLFAGSSGGSTPTADDRGTARTNDAAGDRKVKNRLAGKRQDAKVVSFESDVLELAPGRLLSVADHPHRTPAPNAGLLVAASELRGEYAGQWRVQVEGVPTSAPLRPMQLTPKPIVHGIESATVVGPGGEEIHTDEFGRARVHFRWDRESARNETSSCWLPSNQPWAGNSFGAVNLPRVGQEVLVEFLGGDPDRPVVVGRVYTETNPPPDPLPKFKHVSGLFSESTPRMVRGGASGTTQPSIFGGQPMSPSEVAAQSTTAGPKNIVTPSGTTHDWAGSGFKLDDWSGAENFYIQANKDMHWVIRANWRTVVGAHRTALIGTDEITSVKGNQTIYIGSDQDVLCKTQTNVINANRKDSVGQTFKQIVTKGIRVESTNSSLSIEADEDIVFDSDVTVELRVGSSLIRVDGTNIGMGSGDDTIQINPGSS